MAEKRQSKMDRLMYAYTAECCGRTFHFPGRVPKATYLCQLCKGRMKVKETQVRSEFEAELIVDHSAAFNGERCPDCGSGNNHHPVYSDKDDAYFLNCSCGTELREIEYKELDHEA
jgi:hypothetical protein